MKLNKLFGDRAFYSGVMKIALPMVLQMAVANFVNLLDNIMVGSLGTESMTGVSVVNEFVFVFNLLIFGAIGGAGIFTAQFHGSGDTEGVRYTFRFKLLVVAILCVLGITVYSLLGDTLINAFLNEEASEGDVQLAFSEAQKYLGVILIGFVPFAVSQSYASTLRETSRPVVPMVASIVAVAVNFILNLVLIFGLLGAPALGVLGAAIATTVSRYAEMVIVVVWTHTHTVTHKFARGVFRSVKIPGDLVGKIIIKGMPLVINELFWSVAITLRNQSFSTRGIETVAAVSIATTVNNLFSVVYMAMGTAISVLVGKKLGSGDIEGAKDDDRKLITLSVIIGTVIGCVLCALSPVIPLMYDVDGTVRSIATYMLVVMAIYMPSHAFAHSSYFTLRSGGRVGITMILDSGFMWAMVVPVSVILSNFTGLDIFWLYPLCHGVELLKIPLGAVLLKWGGWARRLVRDKEEHGSVTLPEITQ